MADLKVPDHYLQLDQGMPELMSLFVIYTTTQITTNI